MSDDVQRIFDSVPIPELVDDLKAQLASGSTLNLKFTPGNLHVEAVDAKGASEEYDVEWEAQANRRACTVPVAREPGS